MLSPKMYSDMPGLVDPEVAFHPPPPGVSQGGQPGGFFDAFPGAAAAQQQKYVNATFFFHSPLCDRAAIILPLDLPSSSRPFPISNLRARATLAYAS